MLQQGLTAAFPTLFLSYGDLIINLLNEEIILVPAIPTSKLQTLPLERNLKGILGYLS